MQRDFFNRNVVGIVNNEPSQTVPDDSFTIQELIQRFQSGCMPPVCHTPVFDDDPDIDNPDPTISPDFDLVDRQELSEFAQQTIKDAEQELKTVPDSGPKVEDKSSE